MIQIIKLHPLPSSLPQPNPFEKELLPFPPPHKHERRIIQIKLLHPFDEPELWSQPH